ncbi:diguanylate cyclase (GGDEF)-like protein [Actinoplanes xinjiangensis]|uniref:Diguanylate cyclase (GGDEF)-like protein n=1 Tax=Actinoplanes xinjiangensis TaxID=512350 RepID=A0A316EKW7_9ACTN|nr:bifunctional diguanylate cyclase/phosphodiesterase [Actinoplanes xinjiangensis]PWK31679.1 diguanylate cyclase (GGDEF)-like protein [Actinoplanes xinjiangensis]
MPSQWGRWLVVGLTRIWCWWLAVGVLATTGYFLLPASSLAARVCYNVIGLAAVVAILVGVRLYRPQRPGVWYWVAAGQLLAVLGDITYDYYLYELGRVPYPSIADAFYLASYPLRIMGLLLLSRRRQPGGQTGRLIDAAIAAIGLGLVLWTFILHPTVADRSAPALARVVSTVYPLADLLLLVMLAWLFTDPRNRTPSSRLLNAAAATLLAADTSYSVMIIYFNADPFAVDAVFVASTLLWAAAALHPSMAADPAVVRLPRSTEQSVARLCAPAACSLLGPALLLSPYAGENTIDGTVVACTTIVLILLTIARMALILTQLKWRSRDLERLAMQDEMTGLANRRRFENALREAMAVGSAQVALLGLNGFKNVNDELGRAVGDRALASLAQRLARTVPDDALLARMGGDEFAVLLPGGSASESGALVTQLAAQLREPVHAGGHDLLVGVGIGLADGERDDPMEVLRRAETAMYAAKRAGQAYRRWEPALDEQSTGHAKLGAEMRIGLDAGQFRVVYQPIVAFPEGRIAAVEALVRWEHPHRGTVSPAHFVPVAEQNGLIVELGAWILRTACRQMARWRAELGVSAPDKVSVNVSARQLARPGFATSVADILAETGLAPNHLAVEVTETAVFEGGQAVTTLHELRKLGVQIALDDFGTGHSALGLLQTVPVDILKVDKSFVDNVTEAGRHSAIAEALIQISTELGMTAVAEGVETAEQADALSRLGYTLLQGYYFSRPVAEPDFGRSRTAIAA